MACQGRQGDYLCEGWRARAASIRLRDGNRCRGCNRSEDEVRLEVHHRTYGQPGPCGRCVLTAVGDDDLTLLCVTCHEAVTDVRRRLRYDAREITAEPLSAPDAPQPILCEKAGLFPAIIEPTQARVGFAVPKSLLW